MPRNTKSATGKQASGTGRSTATASRKTATTTASYSEETKLKELFVEELKDIYWAEKHLVKALPKLAKAATSQELAIAFQNHVMET